MKLPSLPLFILDTETTGFVPRTHRIIEFACAVAEGGSVQTEYEQLISIPDGNDIPRAVQVLTRIFPKDLEGKPTFETALPAMQALLRTDAIIVGQNIKFDLGMLKGEGWDLTDRPWVDTAMLASIVFPELASYSLGYVSGALKLDHNPPHRALGDVRATVQLLEKCYERFQSLPPKEMDVIKDFASRAPEGYRRFFEAISPREGAKPKWLARPKNKNTESSPLAIPPAEIGTVQLVPEPLDPAFTHALIAGASGTTWIAVKNIESAVERYAFTRDVAILRPPDFLVSASSIQTFLKQAAFTVDELTLAIKIHLYKPSVRTDIPIHGGEYDVFSGKIAAGKDSPEYADVLEAASNGVAVVSHQQLLAMCSDTELPLPSGISVVIDDASMLEDTATNAFAWFCSINSLRGAAAGHALLTKCTDLIELWAERVRADMSLRYLAVSDLETRECIELKRTIQKLLVQGELSSQAALPLEHLLKILNQDNLAGRFAWIEAMMDGSKIIKSVPEDIGALLHDVLYQSFPTTLLVPPGSQEQLAAIIPRMTKTMAREIVPTSGNITLTMPVGVTMDSIFEAPTGKMIVLAGSKRVIEDVYVKHTERLEKEGVTLFCQGFNGGQSRMQAEFALAQAPAIMVMTPWMFEGVELPEASVDRLVIHTMPFDHPSHAVISRRAQRYKDPFNDYSLPRLQQRLFRLLRTFCRHARPAAALDILDDRIRTKQYGKGVAAYLESLVKPDAKKKIASKTEQMSLL